MVVTVTPLGAMGRGVALRSASVTILLPMVRWLRVMAGGFGKTPD
jgi:hypothetical protein